MKLLTYLSSPYSHGDPNIRQQRFEQVCKVTGLLIKRGEHAFSIILHNHNLAVLLDMPTGWDFWRRYDLMFIHFCKEVLVLTIDGWEQSIGVQAEIKEAKSLGLPVRYVDEQGVITDEPRRNVA